LRESTIKTTENGHLTDIEFMALSPNGNILICSTAHGHSSFLKLPQGIFLNKFRFPAKVSGVQFSEDVKSPLIITTGSFLSIYSYSLDISSCLTAKPILIHQCSDAKYYTCLDTIDSKYLASGTFDGSVHLLKLSFDEETKESKLSPPFILSGLKSSVIGCFFKWDKETKKKTPNEIYAIDLKGNVLHWKKGWEKVSIKNMKLKCKDITCCDISFESNKIVVGFPGGYAIVSFKDDDEEFEIEKNETVSPFSMSSIKLSNHGNWLAMSSGKADQLIVYDIQSETYIMKQQGHKNYSNSICYNSTGDLIASGDDEGKIKVWEKKSGTSFITLDSHKGTITSLKFSRPPGSRDAALFSSSLDGTCRAFDLLRYNNFRTYKSIEPTGFSSMEIDPSGEIICASGVNNFDIFLWNVQTSQLIDVLKSHTAPITEMCFSPSEPVLVSASWDSTVKVWNVFGSKSEAETLTHNAEVVSVDFSPNGLEICTSCLDGTLAFWNVLEASQTGFIDCKRDITTTNNIGEITTSLKKDAKKYFSKVKYTKDGSFIVAGGLNQFLCMYSVDQKVLIKKLILSTNLNLSGVVDMTKFYVDFDRKEKEVTMNKKFNEQRLPGSKEQILPEIKCHDISVSSNEISVSTTQGIVVFSTNENENLVFNPLDIDIDITPQNIQKEIKKNNFGLAFVMSLKLNDYEIKKVSFYSIPKESIEIVVRSIPQFYLLNFMTFLSSEIELNKNIENLLLWSKTLLQIQGKKIQQDRIKFQPALRSLLRSINGSGWLSVTQQNKFTLDYISTFKQGIKRKIEKEESEEEKEEKEEKIQKKQKNKKTIRY
jgi:periodic tryptophan protein 2